MQINITHTTEENIKSLSERLKYFARETNSSRLYVDQKVKSENLRFNLSLVLTHIILNLKFIERSKKVFLEAIEEYNQTNKTGLTFEDFEKANWIRIVAEEVVIPELVRHFVWQVGHYEKEGKPIEIHTDKNHLVRCLQVYHKKCFEDSKLTISKVELEKVLNTYAPKEVNADFLIERDIIGFDSRSGLYYWKGNEYSRHLRNEIASTLWLQIGGEESSIKEFRKFYKLVSGTELWVDDLGSFLSYNNTSKICELAVLFLDNENDLLKSDNEFRKVWLDARSYQHIDIKAEIPVVGFNYESATEFIESVNYHKWRFTDAFDYQRTRNFSHLLIRLIVPNDKMQPSKYENTLRILKDISRPFLLWTLYRDIQSEFPFVIPYLLADSELIPIAFKLIDKVEIDSTLLSDHSSNDRKFEESCEIKSRFWLEMYDLTLEQLALRPSYRKEKGELVAKILIDLSEKVFRINSRNRNSVINHNVLRKRYDEALKKIINKRITDVNSYPNPRIKPRVVIPLLPFIIVNIKEKFQTTNPNHTEFLHLKSGLTDLSIEVLRLSNVRISEGETTKDQKEKVETETSGLVSLLQKYLSEFYSQKELDVQVDNKSGTEKRTARRGVNEFGFETIDWGYLFLHFEKNCVLQNFTDSFTTSLNFNVSSDKYDDQNKEQFEKIKLYLKSLMLGFISIHQKKDLLEIEGLPVKTTLDKLEKWIRDFSLTYSIEDIIHKRIDVFNEMLSVFGYNMYYQHLTSLLYKSINYFNGVERVKFVHDFFAQSTDTGRMLTAINILDSKELRDVISKRISEVKIEDFIENSYTTTELQYALVEAINSTDHWEMAGPLIERIQNHFKQVKHNDERTNYFLFEVNLLLAFKEKNFERLLSLSPPKDGFQYQRANEELKNTKNFFVALYKLYNDKDYDKAITILRALLSEKTKNIRYAFHLYRAETLKAIEVS